MSEPRIQSFQEFWPYYVGEHSLPTTRWLHFLGTTAALALLAYIIYIQNWWLLLALPIIGYGFAWVSHFMIERNRPATFKYPLWSLLGDFKMWWLMATGRMGSEVRRLSATNPQLR